MVFLVPTIQRGNAYPGGSSSKWLIAEMILTVPRAGAWEPEENLYPIYNGC
jgi:hypothetical protein